MKTTEARRRLEPCLTKKAGFMSDGKQLDLLLSVVWSCEPVILALWRQRLEDHNRFEASLIFITSFRLRPCLKN